MVGPHRQRRRHRLREFTAAPDLEAPLLESSEAPTVAASATAEEPRDCALQNGSASADGGGGDAAAEKPLAAAGKLPGSRWWDAGMQATLATVLCLWALKLVQQGYVDGLPVFTGPIYGWSGSENGLLMAVLGFASLPLSFLVGLASPHVSDRALTAGALTVTAVGAALCTKAGDDRFGAAYFGGGGMLYMGTLILEGASMCLLSKVLPASLTRGIFNAGLLTTEAGTLGRFSGNVVMSSIARLTGVDTSHELLEFGTVLYGTFAGLLLLIALYMACVWRNLAT